MGGGPSPAEGGGPWRRFITSTGFGPPRKENDHACKALGYGLHAYSYITSGMPLDQGVSSYLEKGHSSGREVMKEFMSWFEDETHEYTVSLRNG